MSAGSSDEGSATVLSLAALVVLLTVAGVLTTAGRAALLRQRATTAADFAALAAAAEQRTPADRCRRGAPLATANGARLVACAVAGEVVTVTVVQPLPMTLGPGRVL